MSDWPQLPGDPSLPPGCSINDIERAANGSCEVCGRVLGAWNDGETKCHKCEVDERKADED